jgi:phosphatidylserine/phosphatidylglycerophosphate/cardiolipin synthase-like enzyme
MSKSDLDAILETTRRKETAHLDQQVRTARASMQWFLENDQASHPIHNGNALKLLVCGEEGFAAIEEDIRQATSTIDLVCWGFDPAMELNRITPTTDPKLDGFQYWPRGTTYGDLLAEKASQGVQVRLLLWFATGNEEATKGVIELLLGSKGKGAQDLAVSVLKRGVQEATANADIPLTWNPMPGFAETVPAPRLQLRNAKATGQQVRAEYVRAWWNAALSGSIKHLEVRFRETSPGAIAQLKGKYLPSALSAEEELSIALVGTHHQKPILIDYHPGQGKADAKSHTCGYVMGLNSVTDYWDTDQHLYNDPRRETAYGVGAFWLAPWHLKPYRDYAMRVEGDALACLN